MEHPIHRITSASVVGPHTLRLVFEDKAMRQVDLQPVLEGELFGPLQDARLFAQVVLDAETGTVTWPNGADFDPAVLYDWPAYKGQMAAMARRWAQKTRMIAAEKQEAYGTTTETQGTQRRKRKGFGNNKD